MGMSADFKSKIFDPFPHAEGSVTNKILGTNLRMAITRNLVGTIDMESELGQKSCFEVLIDLRIAEDRFVSSAVREEKNEKVDSIL